LIDATVEIEITVAAASAAASLSVIFLAFKEKLLVVVDLSFNPQFF